MADDTMMVGGISLEGRIGGFKPKGSSTRRGKNDGGFPRGNTAGGFPRPKSNRNSATTINKRDSITRKPLMDPSDISHILHATQIQRQKKECQDEISRLEEQYKKIQSKIEAEKLRIGYQEKERDRSEIEETAIRRFKNSAKKGIAYLLEHNYFENGGSAAEVAKFLIDKAVDDTKPIALSKKQIGEYLGEHNPFNLEVLEEFSKLHDLSPDDTLNKNSNVPLTETALQQQHGRTFLASLRKYMWSFSLPGEAQKIDRMMQSFANRFDDCNPGVFLNRDAPYIMAFATIMLNTTLHNPVSNIKLTVEKFVEQGKRVQKDPKDDKLKDIPAPFMRAVYGSIMATPFQHPDGDSFSYMFNNPDKSGYLLKQGGSVKSWTKRWVVISHQQLYYFNSKEDTTPNGIVPLTSNLHVKLMAPPKSSDKGHFFVLTGGVDENGKEVRIKGCKKNKKGIVTQGNHKQYVFRAEDPGQDGAKQVEEWIACIQANLEPTTAFADSYAHRRRTLYLDVDINLNPAEI
eukprot:m.29719 g.29719  ORF g.29719 m.29719 type:complete len:516 (-) comp16147_c0_seq1:73-1620(-)